MIHIIDSDPSFYQVAARIIGDIGFEVKTFRSATLYLAHMRQNNYQAPNAVFSDINTPEMDGLSLIGLIHDRCPELPCYLIITDPFRLDIPEPRKEAIQGVLINPLSTAKLKLVLKGL